MARSLATVVTVTLSLSYLCCVNTYNIDTSNPIIYDDVARNSSERRTYFGYTVLLISDQGWFLIGAPRTNSSYLLDVNEPGVVYKCHIKGTCAEIELDYKGNEKPDSLRNTGTNIWDLKNNSWIGGAMDSERSANGRVVICAPRWINQHYQKRDEYYMTGLCYFMHNDNLRGPAQRLTPTTEDANILFRPPRQRASVYYYGMSQAGMSVHMMPDNEKVGMILGVPGLLNWRGGIVEYPNHDVFSSDGRNKRATDKKKTFVEAKVINPFYANKATDFDFLGYQVSSGKFFRSNERQYVASSPRGNQMTGYVMILSFPPKVVKESKWILYDTRQGQEFGEYFGYSLAVGDINGDALDDLVVGAPTYSNNGEQREIGRIHVFLGSPWFSLQAGDLIKGSSIDGRFGSTLVCLGDIDQDGFADIAVGAPYEDNHRGAIYIYNGSPRGLKVKYSQRIAAAEVDETLRGFGISITPPQDIDGNLYNDIGVGSYLSGHAVLLRTYPVIQLKLSLEPSVYLLKNDSSKFFVRICQSYDGKNAPNMINVTRTLKVDEKYNRVRFEGAVKQVTLQVDEATCENVVIYINSSEERMEDVKISVSQDLVKRPVKRNAMWIKPNSSPTGEDTFCKNCPVVEEASSQKEFTMNLRYARECDPCKSDLHLSADLYEAVNFTSLNGEYVLGSGKIIRLLMNVTNDGHVSYGTFLTVDLPNNVNIKNLPADCQEEHKEREQLSIKCEFKKAIRQGTKRNITLDLVIDIHGAVDPRTGLAPDAVFRIDVNSSSVEQDMQDNFKNLTLKLKTEAYFIIAGQSTEELYSYIIDDEEKKKFDQKYQVIKIGRSPVQEMEIKFDVPMVWTEGNIAFLSMYLPEGRLGDQPVTCFGDEVVKFLSRNIAIKTDSDIDQALARTKRSLKGVKTTEEDVTMKPVQNNHTMKAFETPAPATLNRGVDQYPSNRSLYLNCSTPQVKCYTITCKASQFEVQSLEIELNMFLNVSLLEPLMENKDIIHVSTEGRVSITRPANLTTEDRKGPDHIVISSTFVGSIPEKKVEIWIIVLSVVGGILLLLLIILGLVKAGFFHRKKKEQLQALKDADCNFQNEGSVQLVAPREE